jgi:hypothetical protein
MPYVRENGDPIAVFLFDARKGHCEYFASAMTIMLRRLGIPARLVNGFRAGEYNSLGKDWVVRQYDAHSWVEAYFAPYGWLEFDPTPPDPQRPSHRMARMFSDFADAVSLWWSEEIVNYDRVKQMRLVRSTREVARALQERALRLMREARDASRSLIQPSALMQQKVLAWTAICLAALVAGSLVLRKRWRPRLGRALRRLLFPSDRVFVIGSFYTEALELMHAHGLVRRSDQTPLEFAHSLGAHPACRDFAALTDIYNRIRFGAAAARADLVSAHRVLKSLRTTLRNIQ